MLLRCNQDEQRAAVLLLEGHCTADAAHNAVRC
jgi:hypothetical protein